METLAVLSFMVSVVLAIWGIYQTWVTSRLEVQVHRLAVDLDQTVQRLYRAKELITNLQTDFHIATTASSELNPAVARGDADYLQTVFEKVVASFSRIDVNRSELMALAGVINDNELIGVVAQYFDLGVDSPLEASAEAMTEEMQKLRETSIKAFSRVYKLIALATSDKPEELWFVKQGKK